MASFKLVYLFALVCFVNFLITKTQDDQVKLNDRHAQCMPDVENVACRDCLEKIFKNDIPWCCMASPEGDKYYLLIQAPPTSTTTGDVPLQALFAIIHTSPI
ncbi:hypothetical protein CR513_56083, partial [Mucuna pruriens]